MHTSQTVLKFKQVLALIPVSNDSVDSRVSRLKSTEECRWFIFNALERKRPDLAVQALHRIPVFGGVFGRSRFDRRLMEELLLESGVEGGGGLPAAASPRATVSRLGEASMQEAANPRKNRTSAADAHKASIEWEGKRWAGLTPIDAPADSANDGSIVGAPCTVAAAA